MIQSMRNILRALFRCSLFNPVSWIPVAVLLLVVFGMLHLLGWRDDTAVISGTFAGPDKESAAIRGIFYTLSYFAAIIIAPILLLAAIIYAVSRRLSR